MRMRSSRCVCCLMVCDLAGRTTAHAFPCYPSSLRAAANSFLFDLRPPPPSPPLLPLAASFVRSRSRRPQSPASSVSHPYPSSPPLPPPSITRLPFSVSFPCGVYTPGEAEENGDGCVTQPPPLRHLMPSSARAPCSASPLLTLPTHQPSPYAFGAYPPLTVRSRAGVSSPAAYLTLAFLLHALPACACAHPAPRAS